MKSVVLEIKNGFAAVLSDDGRVTKVKNNDYMIGQVIEMKLPEISKMSTMKKWAVCAASIAVLSLGGGVGVWAYTTPYSYVSLDVNPSIEYTVNRFDIVIGVTAVNDDGESILDQIDLNKLNNSNIKDAIEQTIGQISDDGYFDGSTSTPITAVTGSAITLNGNTDTTVHLDISLDGGIVITTSSEDSKRSEKLAENLQETVEDTLIKNDDNEDVEVEVTTVGLDRVKQARELGVTPGKLNLVEKLQASAEDPSSINLEEWLNKPVKDIMNAIKENKKANTEVKKTSDNLDENISIIDTKPNVLVNTEKEDEKTSNKAIEKSKKGLEKSLAKEEKSVEKKAKKTLALEKKATEKAKKEAKKAAENAKKEAAQTLATEEKVTANAKKDSEQALAIEEKATANAKKEANRLVEKLKKEAELATEKVKKEAKQALATEEKSAEKAKQESDQLTEKTNKETDQTLKDNNNNNNNNNKK